MMPAVTLACHVAKYTLTLGDKKKTWWSTRLFVPPDLCNFHCCQWDLGCGWEKMPNNTLVLKNI